MWNIEIISIPEFYVQNFFCIYSVLHKKRYYGKEFMAFALLFLYD